MEAIKKKMQAMKVEKDNACYRVDVCEEQCKTARIPATSSDDSERAKEVFQSKADENATYADVAKKLATCEGDLEKAEERADVGEDRIIELEGELRVVANLKSLEVAEEKANQREKTYKEQLMMYVNCLKLVDVQKVRPG